MVELEVGPENREFNHPRGGKLRIKTNFQAPSSEVGQRKQNATGRIYWGRAMEDWG